MSTTATTSEKLSPELELLRNLISKDLAQAQDNTDQKVLSELEDHKKFLELNIGTLLTGHKDLKLFIENLEKRISKMDDPQTGTIINLSYQIERLKLKIKWLYFYLILTAIAGATVWLIHIF